MSGGKCWEGLEDGAPTLAAAHSILKDVRSLGAIGPGPSLQVHRATHRHPYLFGAKVNIKRQPRAWGDQNGGSQPGKEKDVLKEGALVLGSEA